MKKPQNLKEFVERVLEVSEFGLNEDTVADITKRAKEKMKDVKSASNRVNDTISDLGIKTYSQIKYQSGSKDYEDDMENKPDIEMDLGKCKIDIVFLNINNHHIQKDECYIVFKIHKGKEILKIYEDSSHRVRIATIYLNDTIFKSSYELDDFYDKQKINIISPRNLNVIGVDAPTPPLKGNNINGKITINKLIVK
jgi:hypothetical protein